MAQFTINNKYIKEKQHSSPNPAQVMLNINGILLTTSFSREIERMEPTYEAEDFFFFKAFLNDRKCNSKSE